MVTYSHDSTSEKRPMEELPDNVFEYNPSPIAMRAVPVLPTEDQAQGANEIGLLSSEYGIAESAEAEAEPASESESLASMSTDTEEEDEGSLLMADVTPDEMCRSVQGWPPSKPCCASQLTLSHATFILSW